jgi:hypothetical protein
MKECFSRPVLEDAGGGIEGGISGTYLSRDPEQNSRFLCEYWVLYSPPHRYIYLGTSTVSIILLTILLRSRVTDYRAYYFTMAESAARCHHYHSLLLACLLTCFTLKSEHILIRVHREDKVQYGGEDIFERL